MTRRLALGFLAAALVVSAVATVWSLSLSGIGPTGWRGQGLFPCELCWYQRILMYPLPVVLGIALWRRDVRAALYVLPLATLGFLVASYHVLLQANPALEPQQCYVGSCTAIERIFLGFTVPQLSLAAFALVAAACVVALATLPRREHS